jgi:hypothetical protein
MISLTRNLLSILKRNKKGGAAGVLIALIIAAAIIIAVYMYTSSQTHPFWEIN